MSENPPLVLRQPVLAPTRQPTPEVVVRRKAFEPGRAGYVTNRSVS